MIQQGRSGIVGRVAGTEAWLPTRTIPRPLCIGGSMTVNLVFMRCAYAARGRTCEG